VFCAHNVSIWLMVAHAETDVVAVTVQGEAFAVTAQAPAFLGLLEVVVGRANCPGRL